MNLYILQLQFNLQNRCNPSKRENRQNGNQESSQETSEEGRKEDHEEGREEEVADEQPKRQHSRGTLKSVPLGVLVEEIAVHD